MAASQTLTTTQETPLAIRLTATDEDPLSYQIVEPPARGALLGTSPTLTYEPDSDYTGPDSFTLVADDGQAQSTLPTVNITVQAGQVTLPETTLTEQPTNPETTGAARFVFTGTGGIACLECSLDGATFATCTSPLEGTNDGLVLAGRIDPASTILKFERQVGTTGVSPASEGEGLLTYADFPVDPTTLTDGSSAEFLTEPVGGDEPIEEILPVEESKPEGAAQRLFLSLVAK